MPVCTLHLLSLSVPISRFLSELTPSSLFKPLIIAKVIRWIITPSTLSVSILLHPPSPWHLFVVSEGMLPLPSELHSLVLAHWSIHSGIPSRLVSSFAAQNDMLLHPSPDDVPPLTAGLLLGSPELADSAQNLELSSELQAWIQSFSKSKEGRGAVSMLNLLAFKPGQKAEYLIYGQAFAESIGAKRGGRAKLVGNVIVDNDDHQEGWDEIAVAHYPTIEHFADMLASEDYQAVNHKHRIPSLKDTCILCTSEIAIHDMLMTNRGKAKL